MLPKIEQPLMETSLSTGEVIKYRPFLVREQKILMMASDEKSSFEEMVRAASQVVNNCTFGELDVETLTMYELQDLFLKIRMDSVGQTQEFNLICGECEETSPYELQLENLTVKGLDDLPDPFLKIGDSMTIKMRYPSALKIAKGGLEDIDYVAECIEFIETEEEKSIFSEATKEEQIEFIEDLPLNIMEEMRAFMAKMPALSHNIDYRCPHCGAKQIVNINGYEHFFA